MVVTRHLIAFFAICMLARVFVRSENNEPEKRTDDLIASDSKQAQVKKILKLEKRIKYDPETETAQQKLLQIYMEQIKPLEEAYRFVDLNRDVISEGEIFAKPMILFLGPWSTGKSTMINYLLGIEDAEWKVHTGAEPTTSDFTVLTHGPGLRIVKGMQLVADKTKHYTPLQKFGLAFHCVKSFLERFQGVELPSPLLEQVTLVDTPGIIENKKQQERGYPFNDVCQWFIDRAQLIFLIFDPTKLDIGSELELLFRQLKGHEAKLRLILNKADTVKTQELMRVYGALFWSLAPLVNEVEPPRVYVASLWSQPYRPGTMQSLFDEEKVSLLTDLGQVIRFQLEHKVASTRRHAFLVRLHALTVENFLNAFNKHKGLIFGNNTQIWQNILDNPDKFAIFSQLRHKPDISVHDLPKGEHYRDFFSVNDLSSFKSLSSHCPLFSSCAMDRLLQAINDDLPNLLNELRVADRVSVCGPGACAPEGKGKEEL